MVLMLWRRCFLVECMHAGHAANSLGANTVRLDTNSASLTGRWYLYEADYTSEAAPGTLLAVSDQVTVSAGDVWKATPPPQSTEVVSHDK